VGETRTYADPRDRRPTGAVSPPARPEVLNSSVTKKPAAKASGHDATSLYLNEIGVSKLLTAAEEKMVPQPRSAATRPD